MCLTPSFVLSGPLAGVSAVNLRGRTSSLSRAHQANIPRARVRMRALAPPNEFEGDMQVAADNSSGGVSTSVRGPSEGDSMKTMSVRRQMEFWFSPANLRRDWYLRRQMDEQGWLDPAVFLKFNRLKLLNVSLAEVIEACKQSDLLEVSSPPTDGSSFGDALGQTRIRRSPSLPSVFSDTEAEAERSVVAENLPKDVSNEMLRQIFAPFGEVTYTWLSKSTKVDRHAIISFAEIGMAIDVLERFEANRPENALEMSVKSKVIWDASLARARNKSVVIEFSGLKPTLVWRSLWKDITSRFSESGLSIVYFLYTNGDPVCYVTVADEAAADVLLSELTEESTLKIGQDFLSVRPLSSDDDLEKYWARASEQTLERKRKKDRMSQLTIRGRDGNKPIPAGVIVRIDEIPESIGWKSLMSELQAIGNIVFLNYRRGDTSCYVRYQYPDLAKQTVDALSGSSAIPLGGALVKAHLLEGDEEKAYWNRWYEERKRK